MVLEASAPLSICTTIIKRGYSGGINTKLSAVQIVISKFFDPRNEILCPFEICYRIPLEFAFHYLQS